MAKWVLFLLVLIARPALAGHGLDVNDWLSRPGVKLLAVEFYASWCGPCKRAVPQWKALHEEYRDQGLRLVVVSVQDPDGACVNPGWNPDDVICDTEGHLAEAWGVGGRLPAAFLWSWRGPLLVRRGHFDEVARQVEAELGRLPRVTLHKEMPDNVRQLLRSELARSGKVDVVAGEDEETALAAIRRKSHEVQFSDQSACKLGQRLAANSLLKASFVATGNSKRLLVQLFSAETGCLNASAGVYWNEDRPELSVAEAVDELVNNLRVKTELPRADSRTSEEGALVSHFDEQKEEARLHLFHVGLSFADGVLFAGDSAKRSAASGALSTWMKWEWFRWEPVFVAVNFEGANTVILGSGACWDIPGGFYLRSLVRLAFADTLSYWGLLGGAGYSLRIGRDWYIDAEVDASFWPGDILACPLEARLGVRYGF